MYSVIHSNKIQRGLVKGFRCPVSGKPFAAVSPSKALMQELLRQQREYSASLYLEQDGGVAQPDRSLDERRTLWKGQHSLAFPEWSDNDPA